MCSLSVVGVCCLSRVVCYVAGVVYGSFIVCCLLSVNSCGLMLSVCCFLFVARSSLFVVCGLMVVVCCCVVCFCLVCVVVVCGVLFVC